MARSVVLNNVAHKDLRVKPGYSAEFGDAINNCIVFPTEFAFVQREYPIVFRRDTNGDLVALAMLGFEKEENLFLDGKGGWDARYVPAAQARGPFLIGLQPSQDGDGNARKPVINVDLDDPRISRTEGVPVFLPQGGNAPYLEHVNRMLQLIYDGSDLAKSMFAAFEEAGLIEGMELDVKLDASMSYKVPGFLTISQEKLAGLTGETLEKLHSRGFLHLAALVATSLGNVTWLVELKNRKRAAENA